MIKRLLSTGNYWKNLANKAKTYDKSLIMNLPSKNPVELCAVPLGEIYADERGIDPFDSAVLDKTPDFLFLGVDSSEYLDRFKVIGSYMSNKQYEGLRTEQDLGLDILGPGNWFDLVGRLGLIDAIKTYETNKFVDKDISMANLGEPKYDDMSKQFEALNSGIYSCFLGKKFPRHIFLYNVLLMGLMNGYQIILGDMPEPLFRIKLANSLSIEELREMFFNIIQLANDHYSINSYLISLEDIVYSNYPEIMLPNRVEYMLSLLYEISQEHSVIGFIGNDAALGIADCWNSPLIFNHVKATPELLDEHQSIQIEKHVILDILLESKAWNGKHKQNRFPYLKHYDADRKNEYKSIFHKFYIQYQDIVTNSIKAQESVKLNE